MAGKRDDRFTRLLITSLGGGLLATSIVRLVETAFFGQSTIWVELAVSVVGFGN